jgi:DNA-directed RNA polymerase specialized sigma24 family protein
MTIESESRLNGPASPAILSAGMLVPVDPPVANSLPSEWFADKTADASLEAMRLQAAKEVSLGNSWSTREVEEPSTESKSPPSAETGSSDDDGVTEDKLFAPPTAFNAADPLSIILAEETAGEAEHSARRRRGYRASARQKVKAAIGSLSKAQRRTTEGVIHANGSFVQAAQDLGTQESTVRRTFQRSAATVRKSIGKAWEELFPSSAFCSKYDAHSTWLQSLDQVDTRDHSDGHRHTQFDTKKFLTGGRSNAMSKLDAPIPRGGGNSSQRGDWSFKPSRPDNRMYVGQARSRKADPKPKNGRYQGGTAHLPTPTLH